MKRKLLFTLLLALLALSTTALAAQHTDAQGAVWETDGIEDYAPEAAALAEESGLIPLGDPSNLRWDTEVHGQIRWETEGAFQKICKIAFYEVNDPEQLIWQTDMHYFANFTGPFVQDFFNHDVTSSSFLGEELPSGDYYFTIQNIGDGITYGDSAVVSSLDTPDGAGVYHYADPGADSTLKTPEAGHWDWPAAVWDDRQEADPQIEAYSIDYGYSETKAAQDQDIRLIGGSAPVCSGIEDEWLQERLIGEHGAGWYYFRVRALSADIEQWRNSALSEWSEGYNLAEASQKITDQLNQIDTDTAAPEDIRKAVQDLNQTELQNALTADILGAETGAADALSALEAKLGGPAKPAVSQELQDRFDVNGVSIVGAALNNVTGSDTPTLNIGAPKQSNHVRDEMYNSTVAVDFSMELENVENTHELAVPVKVTLPVPAGVNPAVLAILHYRADGTYEELFHNTFEQGGHWFVSFVLTSFSDFTLTELLDGDGNPAIQFNSQTGRYQAVNPPEGARLYLARYAGGRMTSLEELKALSGTLAGSGAKKLFLLDGDLRPLCAAASLT